MPTPARMPPDLRRFATIASWIILGAGLILVLKLRLLTSLMAGLLVYELINSVTPALERRLPGPRARWLAVALISSVIVALLTLAAFGVISLVRYEINNPSVLLGKVMGIIDRARDQLPAFVVSQLPASVDEFRTDLLEWLRAHVAELQTFGKSAAHVFVTMLAGMVLGAMVTLHQTNPSQHWRPLAQALLDRLQHLATAFHDIVFAQIRISALNTILTSLFLLAVLPLFGVQLPLTKTLIIITFVAGLLPVIGNLISNTAIFIVGLSVSLWVAVVALAYLIIIHKLEYFLNARIVGTQIKARAWELLLAMLLMEAAFGLPGLIAAPVFYAYLKRELTAAGLI